MYIGFVKPTGAAGWWGGWGGGRMVLVLLPLAHQGYTKSVGFGVQVNGSALAAWPEQTAVPAGTTVLLQRTTALSA